MSLSSLGGRSLLWSPSSPSGDTLISPVWGEFELHQKKCLSQNGRSHPFTISLCAFPQHPFAVWCFATSRGRMNFKRVKNYIRKCLNYVKWVNGELDLNETRNETYQITNEKNPTAGDSWAFRQRRFPSCPPTTDRRPVDVSMCHRDFSKIHWRRNEH